MMNGSDAPVWWSKLRSENWLHPSTGESSVTLTECLRGVVGMKVSLGWSQERMREVIDIDNYLRGFALKGIEKWDKNWRGNGIRFFVSFFNVGKLKSRLDTRNDAAEWEKWMIRRPETMVRRTYPWIGERGWAAVHRWRCWPWTGVWWFWVYGRWIGVVGGFSPAMSSRLGTSLEQENSLTSESGLLRMDAGQCLWMHMGSQSGKRGVRTGREWREANV